MKYYKLNDTDSIITKDENNALTKFKDLFGIVISETYTEEEFRAEHEIDIIESELKDANVYDGDDEGAELITAQEFFNRYPDLESPHFSSEI